MCRAPGSFRCSLGISPNTARPRPTSSRFKNVHRLDHNNQGRQDEPHAENHVQVASPAEAGGMPPSAIKSAMNPTTQAFSLCT